MLDAKLGHWPSFLWYSLVVSIPLIKECLFWSIANGQHTKIWGDKWLPVPFSYCVESPIKTLHRDSRVSKLIDRVLGGWNLSLVNQMFNPEEVAIVSSIPLSKLGAIDKVTWRPFKDGKFSVKFAYHLEMQRVRSTLGESSACRTEDPNWKDLWKLEVLVLLSNLCGGPTITFFLPGLFLSKEHR